MSLNELLSKHSPAMEEGSMIPEHILNASENVRNRLCALKKLQLQTVAVQTDFYRKVHELETEFRSRYDAINKQVLRFWSFK
jgi:hypothetical protein